MKKYTFIFLSVLLVGLCATNVADAKKRSKSRRAAAITTTTVNKEDFVSYWSEKATIHPYQLDITYDPDSDTFYCELNMQVTETTGSGKLKGNTITFKCEKGCTITATLKDDVLHVYIKRLRGRSYSTIML